MSQKMKQNLMFIGNQAAKVVTNKTFRVSMMLFMFGIAMLRTALPAFAATTDIINGIRDGMSEIYTIILYITIPVTVVFVAFAAFKAIWGGDKGMETAKATIVRLVIGLAIVYLAPLLVVTAAGWFDNSGDEGVFDHMGE